MLVSLVSFFYFAEIIADLISRSRWCNWSFEFWNVSLLFVSLLETLLTCKNYKTNYQDFRPSRAFPEAFLEDSRQNSKKATLCDRQFDIQLKFIFLPITFVSVLVCRWVCSRVCCINARYTSLDRAKSAQKKNTTSNDDGGGLCSWETGYSGLRNWFLTLSSLTFGHV